MTPPDGEPRTGSEPDPVAAVLRVDAGGTHTRAVATTLDGRRSGRGVAGGGNPLSNGPEEATRHLTQAVRGALEHLDGAPVEHVVLGMAGLAALREPAVHQAYEEAFAAAGVRCRPDLVSDVALAFAAGTPEPAGTVLIAGTGAVAAEVSGGEVVGVADGLGWLLGDQGSGFWIGRAAARATARRLARRQPLGPLTGAVARHVLGEPAEGVRPDGLAWRDVFAARVHSRRPLLLAELAPLVSTAAEAGDPVALDIVAAAADHLVRTVAEVRDPASPRPVVLSGSVVTSDGPVRAAVTARLRERWDTAVTAAGDAAAAAAWLAGRRSGRLDAGSLAALYDRLVARGPVAARPDPAPGEDPR